MLKHTFNAPKTIWMILAGGAVALLFLCDQSPLSVYLKLCTQSKWDCPVAMLGVISGLKLLLSGVLENLKLSTVSWLCIAWSSCSVSKRGLAKGDSA